MYGNELLKICNSHGMLVYLPDKPMHYAPTGQSDIIEIAINKNTALQMEIYSEDELSSSDHNPIR